MISQGTDPPSDSLYSYIWHRPNRAWSVVHLRSTHQNGFTIILCDHMYGWYNGTMTAMYYQLWLVISLCVFSHHQTVADWPSSHLIVTFVTMCSVGTYYSFRCQSNVLYSIFCNRWQDDTLECRLNINNNPIKTSPSSFTITATEDSIHCICLKMNVSNT